MPDPKGLNPEPATKQKARVFFALWPDEATRAALAKEAKQLHGLRGGRMTRPETIHLTLLFIGDLARERLPALRETARGVRAPAFEVDFDHEDCWRHNRIAFLGAGVVPEALSSLVAGLEAGADALGIRFDRRAYTPHITLLRQANCAKPEEAGPQGQTFQPIRWRAEEFVLVESRLAASGSTYTVLERFALL